ncbi:MAG: RNA polymerase subunit sigma-70 [Oscillospiraceae bacterium]|nr:RNA polymerase subunit sigma-70 [Oscillospiraceae bacterium]
MTAKEYLSQEYRLDQRINSDIAELSRLRTMSKSISSSGYEEKYGQKRAEAPFVKQVEKIVLLENMVNAEIDRLVELKAQIRLTIDTVSDTNERMVLRMRYIENKTWEKIGLEMFADSRTVRRWHGNALNHVVMPENPIKI